MRQTQPSQRRHQPCEDHLRDLVIADGVGMNSVIIGIAIDWINIQFSRNDADFRIILLRDIFQLTLDQSMLNRLPAFASIAISIVGLEGFITGIGRRRQAETNSRDVVATKPKVSAVKKKSITCTNGKLTKKIVGANPKCPTGFKKK